MHLSRNVGIGKVYPVFTLLIDADTSQQLFVLLTLCRQHIRSVFLVEGFQIPDHAALYRIDDKLRAQLPTRDILADKFCRTTCLIVVDDMFSKSVEHQQVEGYR